jgi:hypothetical protein
MHTLKPQAAAGNDLLKPLAVLALVGLTAFLCWLMPGAVAGGESGVVMDLPYSIGPLLAFSQDVSQAELTILPADTTFARKTYGTPDSAEQDRILCSIILSGREKRSIHRPERCLPAQGWRIESSRVVTIPLASGHKLQATALLLERPVALTNGTTINLDSYFLYWFVGKGITTPSQLNRILLTNWEMLTSHVNQRWAYVIVQANILKGLEPQGQGPEETLSKLETFIHNSVPYYMKSEMTAPEEVSSK